MWLETFLNSLIIALIIVLILFFLIGCLVSVCSRKQEKGKKAENNSQMHRRKKETPVNEEESSDKNSIDRNEIHIVKECEDKISPKIAIPKITITSRKEYSPTILQTAFDFKGKTPNPRDDERYYLLLTKSAVENIKKSLDWGHKTKNNQVEQGGVLLGNVCRYKNEVYSIVIDILLAATTGNPVFVEFTNAMWADMQDRLDEKNLNRSRNEQLVILGWFHTHPNNLSVFMSGTDMTTQRLNFSQEWQASLVMNPHTNDMKAFFGHSATNGKIVPPEKWENFNE
ncbi:MAG: hypothetical protein LBM93_02930 [Oscillospiraceae bacterium]|jgi:proteasome lid subunit RPN8/RPN11|nr:hypothetical protein [Oscillospiraceae bacterium]